MTTVTQIDATIQVYRVYIKATPQAIWDAITKTEWTQRYGYCTPQEIDLRPGGGFTGFASEEMCKMGVPEVAVTGEVIEADPPHRLVLSWHPVWDPQAEQEAPTRLTYEIDEGEGGVTSLTVIHDVTGAPGVAAMVAGAIEGAGGGWSYVLSDLKTLLETGRPLEG